MKFTMEHLLLLILGACLFSACGCGHQPPLPARADPVKNAPVSTPTKLSPALPVANSLPGSAKNEPVEAAAPQLPAVELRQMVAEAREAFMEISSP